MKAVIGAVEARSDEGGLRWERDGVLWPHRQASRFLSTGGLHWHVQCLGSGPTVVLVHGTGASTHSWGGVAAHLAGRFRVVAMDLPGHGFTTTRARFPFTLPAMARALGGLLHTLEVEPQVMVGHSAGAAILCRLTLDEMASPRAVVSLNGALLPLRGMAGQLFGPVARAMAGLRLVPALFARYARNPGVAERLIRQTGSTPDAASLACYRALLRSPRHVTSALTMMANWDLAPLTPELARLGGRLHLVACDGDRTVSPAECAWLAGRLEGVSCERLPGLGHLGHEERPGLFAELITRVAADHGVATAAGSSPPANPP